MKKFFILISFIICYDVSSQESLKNLFIKCDRCDNNFLKNEISFVNHVREQALADIQLFIYRNRNANNGNRYSLDFIGKIVSKEGNYRLILIQIPDLLGTR